MMVVAVHFLLLFLFASVEFIDCAVKFRRKEVVNGVKFLRELSFSNKTLLSEIGKMEEYKGVNILLVGDYSLYKSFVEITRGDETTAQHSAREYLTAIFEQMRSIYDEIRFDFGTLHLKLVDSFVAIRPIDCPLLQPDDMSVDELERNATLEELFELKNGSTSEFTYSGPNALWQLGKWIKKYEDLLPPHDHAMLVTKMDVLSFSGSDSSQGIAPLAAACRPGESTSVVEDVGAMATAVIAAHELGHNIGSPHDSANISEECDNFLSYLMAPTVSGKVDDDHFFNIRRMSPCSLKSIQEYISSPSARCLQKRGRLPKRVGGADYELTTSFPGERFSASRQCQTAFGPNYGLCPKPEYTYLHGDPCRRVWCKDRRARRTTPCETMAFLPALDGTKCGLNRWCMKGECVTNPKKMLECKDLNEDVCRKYSKVKLRHYCKAKDFQDICCQSCHKALLRETQLEKKV